MNYWPLYFLIKVGLDYAGYLKLWWWAELAMAAVVLWPLPGQRLRWLRWLRLLAALFVAVVLTHAESSLPSFAHIYSQLGALFGLSLRFWIEILQRIITPDRVLLFVAPVIAYRLLAPRLRFATLAMVGIISLPIVAALTPVTNAQLLASAHLGAQAAGADVASPLGQELAAFYADERNRRVEFTRPAAGLPDYDLIVLHVCSIAWDDMAYIGEDSMAFLKRFDVIFSRFNTAATYSGPAALRVLHGACGQVPHKDLYGAIPLGCNPFADLETIGYKREALLNHNGHYDDFANGIREEGGFGKHLEYGLGAPVAMRAFDDSLVYRDYDVLARWWAQRQQLGNTPVALYYDTISLHDGNQLESMPSKTSMQTYKPRFLQLMADFDRFTTLLQKSGRPIILVLLPEHGAALRGNNLQVQGMREIPSPDVTLVPAGVKVINPPGIATARPLHQPISVDKPTSYLDLFQLVAGLIAQPPLTGEATGWESRIEAIQGTRFVAENAQVIMMQGGDGSYKLRSGDGPWINYAH